MRSRLMLAAALGAVAILPSSIASAGHRSIPIYLFSNFRVQTGQDDPRDPGDELQPGNPTVVSSAVGCVVVAQDIPETDGIDESNTDYIYPGSNNFQARWLEEGTVPAFGTISFAGEVHGLEFAADSNDLVEVVDSNRIYFDPALSIDGGEAVVTVCRDEAGQDCETRTYRTISEGPR